jgi:hypothetical protein
VQHRSLIYSVRTGDEEEEEEEEEEEKIKQ